MAGKDALAPSLIVFLPADTFAAPQKAPLASLFSAVGARRRAAFNSRRVAVHVRRIFARI
jgi:hypothetical protein